MVNQLGDAQEHVLGGQRAHCSELDDARRALRKLVADGDRIQAEREVFRRHAAAAVVQGYRTRDAAFRLFRNEKLERYKTLFDLAARMPCWRPNAFDYETGLLGAEAGPRFQGPHHGARALGVVRDGEPQFAGQQDRRPGISSALAEMRPTGMCCGVGSASTSRIPTTPRCRSAARRSASCRAPMATRNWKDVLIPPEGGHPR
jgi:hypothetical protein